MDDRRKHRRVPVKLPATYRSANRTVDAYVANLSQGGLFIMCEDIDDVGTPAEVAINLPGESPLVVSGSVAWCVHGQDSRGMGFRFADLGRRPRLLLANYLLRSNSSDESKSPP